MGASKDSAGMSKDAKEKLEEFRNKVKERAHKMVHEVMPQKVNELTTVLEEAPMLLEDPQSMIQSFDWADSLLLGAGGDASEETGSRKKRKLEENGEPEKGERKGPRAPKFVDPVPCNKALKEFHMNVLKPEVRLAIDCANAVKVWIQLNIPRIETGDNFGLEVQQEVLEEFTRAENNGLTILDQMMKYYCNRAKLTSKVLKYPNVHDYRQAIVDLDMKEQLSTKLCMMDVRNAYATLHDVVMKNYDKLNKPRRTDSTSQFY